MPAGARYSDFNYSNATGAAGLPAVPAKRRAFEMLPRMIGGGSKGLHPDLIERRRKACDELHVPRASLGAGSAATAPCGWYIHTTDPAQMPAHRKGRWELGAQEMQNAKCRMQNVHHDLLPSLGRRKERVGGEPTPGRYCGGAVALKKAGGSAFSLPPGLRK